MRRPLRPLLAALLLILASSPVGATPIEITSGFIIAENHVVWSPMALAGDPLTGQRFTFVGTWSYIIGGLGLFGALVPGQLQSNDLVAGPDSVLGTATLEGQTYQNVGSGTAAPVPPWLTIFLRISSSFVLPPIGDPPIVTVPFTLTGVSVQHQDAAGAATITDDLVGFGLSTIALTPCPACGQLGLDSWNWVSVRYDFMEPVPEPGTLLLLASGLVGLCGPNWRRRRRTPPG